MIWAILAALAVGLLLLLIGRRARVSRGLAQGRSLALDNRNLYSRRLGLAGRPDRIVEEGGFAVPEEWKSGRRVHDSHRAQMGAYFLLMEEESGVRPPHGYIVLGDGRREKVENTDELRAWVLGVAEQIRAARRDLGREIPVRQPAGKCRGCGVREACGQRSDR